VSVTATNTYRRQRDHFEPTDLDPQDQRRLRAQLEQIDYAAFIANREILGQTMGPVDPARLQRLAVSAAVARGKWVSHALTLSESGRPVDTQQAASLTALRVAYEELAEAYEGLRRMVERGYVAGPAPAER
jgi:hypothetical protein